MIFLAFFSPLDCLALLDNSSAVTPLAPSPPLLAPASAKLESLSLSAASFLGSSNVTFFVESISVSSGMFPAIKWATAFRVSFYRIKVNLEIKNGVFASAVLTEVIRWQIIGGKNTKTLFGGRGVRCLRGLKTKCSASRDERGKNGIPYSETRFKNTSMK